MRPRLPIAVALKEWEVCALLHFNFAKARINSCALLLRLKHSSEFMANPIPVEVTGVFRA